MQVNQVIEISGAVFSIVYSLLLMREKTAGWWFGIVASLLSAWVFYTTKIYAQATISIYFAAVGVYGLWYWKKAEKRDEHIHVWPVMYHVYAVVLFSILSMVAAYFFKTYTDSTSPYLDSFATLFGLLASFKEARKILTSWVYWFVINAVSVVLYYQQGLIYYGVIMVVYTIICIPGFLNWYRIYKQHRGR
jgi:nicotinamide mononucleotide transporter